MQDMRSISKSAFYILSMFFILYEAHLERVQDMLVYMHLIVREARKFSKGVGWLTYDSVFQQNNQGLDACWDKLDPSLHTTYIGGQGIPAATPCRHCRGVDHSSAGCALSPLTPVTKYGNQTKFEKAADECKPRQPSTRPAGRFICRSWNAGKCRFPGTCYYRHVCSTCNEQHMARECPLLQPQRVEGPALRQRLPPGTQAATNRTYNLIYPFIASS